MGMMKSSHKTSEVSSQQELLDQVVGKCPIVQARLAGSSFLCLVDSGSEVTTVTESFYLKNLWGKLLQGTHDWIQLKAANGLNIPCFGLLQADFEFNGKLFKKACVLVVKDPSDAATSEHKQEVRGVVGCNILKEFLQSGDMASMMKDSCQDSHAVAQKLKLVQAKVACCQRISAEASKGNSSLVGHARVLCWKGPVCIPAQ